jgi:hypothetical protein
MPRLQKMPPKISQNTEPKNARNMIGFLQILCSFKLQAVGI